MSSWHVDADGDGYAEQIYVDTDGDGYADAVHVDTDLDGFTNFVEYDSDGDGILDSCSVDLNHDGVYDATGFDSDGNGTLDTIWFDHDHDGQIDLVHTGLDDPAGPQAFVHNAGTWVEVSYDASMNQLFPAPTPPTGQDDFEWVDVVQIGKNWDTVLRNESIQIY